MIPGILDGYKARTFIETGTYDGDGCLRALAAGFERVVSVEMDFHRCQKCRERFSQWPNVVILEGDSAKMLGFHLPDERCVIYLDAHGPTAPDAQVVAELSVIRKKGRRDHVILIDDMPKEDPIFPTEDVVALLMDINPGYSMKYIGDGRVLVAEAS